MNHQQIINIIGNDTNNHVKIIYPILKIQDGGAGRNWTGDLRVTAAPEHTSSFRQMTHVYLASGALSGYYCRPTVLGYDPTLRPIGFS